MITHTSSPNTRVIDCSTNTTNYGAITITEETYDSYSLF